MRRRYQYILDNMHEVGIEFGGLAIDCACGLGQGSVALADAGYQVVGFDIKEARVKICKDKGIDARLGNIMSVELPSNYADLYVSSETLEHLEREDSVRAAKDMMRICKIGGIIAITVPESRKRCLRSKHHKQFLSADDLREIFVNADELFHGVFYKHYPRRGSTVMIFGNQG